MLTAVLILAACLGLAALAGGYGGALHPAGDSLAAFRPHVAVALLILAVPLLLLGPRGLGLLAAAAALAALAGLAVPRLLPRPAGPFLVYQKNLEFDTEELAQLIWDIEATAPDVVLLQEVTGANEEVLRLLSRSHPAQHRCPSHWLGDTAILSRHPAVPGTARCAAGAAILRVSAPDGPLWLASVHLRWPWPYGQMAQAATLAEALAELDGPAVIAGDMNAAPWSRAVRRIARAAGARPVRPAPPTLRIGGVLPVAIDHVLATGPGRSKRRPLAGSDHHGVLARVAPFAAAAARRPEPAADPADAEAAQPEAEAAHQPPMRAGSKG